MGHLPPDEQAYSSSPLRTPHRGGPRALLVVVVVLLATLAVVLSTLAAVDAYVAALPPISTPESSPLPKGRAVLVASEPTAGRLSPDTYSAITAEANARSMLPTDGDASGNRYSRGLAGSAVGQVFGPKNNYCTATVVESRSERVAVTAAHCVYRPPVNPYYSQPDPPDHGIGWTHLDTFIPGRSGDDLPYGRWLIQGAWVDPVWRQTGDPRYDVAFLRLGTHNGVTPQRALGAEGVVFDGRSGGAATVLGYPGRPPFDGTSLRRCATPMTVTNPRVRTIELRCRQTEGSSGGPWLADFDTATGRGAVMAVTGYGSNDYEILGGDRLGAVARRLYTEADTDAPHR